MKTRKEIVTNTYCFGGLTGAIILGIVAFIGTRNDPWFARIVATIAMTIMSPGVIGVALGGIVFILTLPFYRYIPWDLVESVVEENTGCRYCSATLYKKLDYNDSSTEFCDDDCEGAWMRGYRIFPSDKSEEPEPIKKRWEILDFN
jgi:hypothetical protein